MGIAGAGSAVDVVGPCHQALPVQRGWLQDGAAAVTATAAAAAAAGALEQDGVNHSTTLVPP